MKKHLVFCMALVLGSAAATLAVAAPGAPQSAASDHIQLAPADLHWMPVPAVLPPGAKIAILRGNPFAEGLFTVRLWMPAHYTIPPHWHPTAESFTVIKGQLFIGMGDKIDKSKAQPVPTLGFGSLPAMHHHYAYTGNEGAVIDLTAYGPFQIYYVNPADAPSVPATTQP